MNRRLWALLLVAGGACQCDDVQTRPAVPVAEVEPGPGAGGERVLDFGGVPVGSLSVLFISVASTGATPLELRGTLTSDSSPDIFTRVPSESVTLVPGESARYEVRYVPAEPGPDEGAVVLITNDPAQERIVIKIRGRGMSAGIRVCAVLPAGGEQCHDEVLPNRLVVDLGNVTVGSLGSRNVKVYSTGDRPLRVGKMALALGTPAGWSLDPAEVEQGFGLESGQDRTVSVIYDALYGGAETGELEIVSDDPDEPRVVVDLRVSGVGPRLCIEPSPVVDFGEVAAGSKGTRDVDLVSCGTETLSINDIGAPGGEFGFEQAPPATATLAPAQRLTLHLKYQPVDARLHETRMVVTHSDGQRAFINLRGSGALCDLEAAPDPVNFGLAPSGTRVARTLVLRNIGNSDCRVDQIGPPTLAAFTVTAAPTTPLVLAPGRQTNVTLTFAPTAVQSYSADLRVASNDADRPQRDVRLLGSGQSVPACAFEADPASLSFGNLSAGGTATLPVTITQRGTDECTLGSAGFTTGSSSAFTAQVLGSMGLGGVQLSTGDAATVLVTFRPTTPGTHTGDLDVKYGTNFLFPGQSLIVPVIGTVAEPRICVNPAQITFTGVNTHAEQILTITSCGAGDLTVRRLGMAPGTSRDLTLLASSRPALPLRIPAGQQRTVIVAYDPRAPGADYGAVEIGSNDAIAPLVRVPIRANGVTPQCGRELRCAPASLEFPDTEVGRTAALSITCISTGTQAVTATAATLGAGTSSEFSAVPAAMSITLQPGDSLRVEVLYTPVDAGGDVGTVEIVNDGCDPKSIVQVTGVGKIPNFPPCPPPQIFSPVIKWQWTGGSLPDSRNVGMTPVVVNLTDDNADGAVDENDKPDVVFISCKLSECCVGCTPGQSATFADGDYSGKGILRAVHGTSGAELWNVTAPELMLTAAAQVAAADLDGDNFVEIIAPKHSFRRGQQCPPPMPSGVDFCGKYSVGTLLAFDRHGRVFWESEPWKQPDTEGENGSAPLLADLDQDGFPEIIFGLTVFDRNGRKKWDMSGPTCGSTGHGCFPVAADLDDDGKLEVIGGKNVYNADGTLRWTAPISSDGLPIVIDVDGDGVSPEVIYRPATDELDIVRADGTLRKKITINAVHPDACPAPIAAADLTGDARRELIVPTGDNIHAISVDGTFLWSRPINDAGGQCGASGAAAFDFEGDGKYEAVYHDTTKIWAFRGNGTVIFESERESVTLFETPVIADVDNDNHADLLFTNTGTLIPPASGVMALSNTGNNWPATRRVWLQYGYHVTDANENGTIPRRETPHWKGSNMWRANVPLCR